MPETCCNKLDLLESKLQRATAQWQQAQQSVEEMRYNLAIRQAYAQNLYEKVRSLNDSINLIQGRKLLAQQQVKIGRTTYCGSKQDCGAAQELINAGIGAAGIRQLIKSGQLKLQRKEAK